ncbi:RNA polymerase sigma factor [Roseiconus lacunae]|uniref:RNA polymerase sigma factor n=1 Tax=Roseiconus lacunae TaxID=2605694 RepID=UPI0011F31766|nr:sigma-70 family RNA polymerase sigma factor [Roseiconus lacunae]MCD0461615.1 sigma-70 family RNA polymerase sigma factor [Roseiconus lacunae]WRQ51047.1 sigma-70 family RNA polymerase sigma factor [Stieleria sp. HD01]
MNDVEQLGCDDPSLVERACDGNSLAFTRLIQCNRDKLFASLCRFLDSPVDAEEALQEAFVRAFTRIESFKRNSKFSTWLYRIALNTAITNRQKNRRAISIHGRDQQYLYDFEDSRYESAESMIIREEQKQLVHAALDRLNDDHRAILILREMDDLAYEEIASVLGIPINTVRSRLSRARDRMREVVEELQQYVAEPTS